MHLEPPAYFLPQYIVSAVLLNINTPLAPNVCHYLLYSYITEYNDYQCHNYPVYECHNYPVYTDSTCILAAKLFGFSQLSCDDDPLGNDCWWLPPRCKPICYWRNMSTGTTAPTKQEYHTVRSSLQNYKAEGLSFCNPGQWTLMKEQH